MFLLISLCLNYTYKTIIHYDNIERIKGILSGDLQKIDSQDNIHSIKSYEQNSISKEVKAESLFLITEKSDYYIFQIKDKNIFIKVFLGEKYFIKEINIIEQTYSQSKNSDVSVLNYSFDNEEDVWHLNTWKTDDNINMVFSQETTSLIEINLNNIKFNLEPNKYTLLKEEESHIIFKDIINNIQYSISIQPIIAATDFNDIYDYMDIWKNETKNIFSLNSDSSVFQEEKAFLESINPTAINVLEIKDNKRKQEAVLMIVFLPEEKKQINIIAYRDTYELSSDVSLHELSLEETQSVETTTAIIIESIEEYPIIKNLRDLMKNIKIIKS